MTGFASETMEWVRRRAVPYARCLVPIALAALVIPVAIARGGPDTSGTGDTAMDLEITSTAFTPGGSIPVRYTCDGEDVSPPLAFSGVPKDARSLVLIEDDPDAPDPKAPRMVWVHWIVYNLPPDTHGLAEAVKPDALPRGALEGINDWKRTGYGGPCPPVGRHRYFHKLYALDVVLPDLHQPTRARLETAMHGHILAQAALIGTYQRDH